MCFVSSVFSLQTSLIRLFYNFNMPEYKLVYFNLRGRAENARVMFKMAGVKFEDKRIESEDWPKFKETTPNGQVPLLFVDGKTFCQSKAIDQYLAETFGYFGKSAGERLRINQLIGNMTDIFQKWPFNEKDEKEKEKKMKEILDELFPKVLDQVNNEVCTKFFLGDHVSLADVVIMNISTVLDGLRPNLLEKYKNVKAITDNTKAIPEVKAWLAERPKTNF